jgi:hypothetical protein
VFGNKYIYAPLLDNAVCRMCGIIHGGIEELYDLNADPDELINIAEEKQSVLSDLKKQLQSFIAQAKEKKHITEEVQAFTIEDKEKIKQRLGGTYIKENPNLASYTYGSWSGSDGNTGVLKSSPIKIEFPAYLVMYIMTGPTPIRQTVGLDTDGDSKPDILYTGNAEHQWAQWVVDLTPYINKEISIVASDKGTDSGEWGGVSEPFIFKMNK